MGSNGAMLAAVEDVGDVDLRLADEIRRGPIRQDCSLGHSGSPAPSLAVSLVQLTLQVRAFYVFRGAQVMRHFWVERVSYPCHRIPTRGHGGVLRET